MSLVLHPSEVAAKEGKTLTEFCKQCTKSRLAIADGPINESTGQPYYKKGDFIIDCHGIPDQNKFIPHHDKFLAKIEKENEAPLTESEIKDLTTLYDPVEWAAKYFDWHPRVSRQGEEYQANILRCSSKRKVLRCGRRLGKSEILLIWALFRMFNNSPKQKRWDAHQGKWVKGFSSIMFLAPYLSQVKDFFSRLEALIYSNPELADEIESYTKTPYYKLELKSGMVISGFSAGSSGASSVRGQKADFILLDEMDYLKSEDMTTIMALIMEHNDVEMIAASTPSGRREHFYEFCTSRMNFKEFHYTSMANPSWGPKMEVELRELYRTDTAWQHEILAAFGEASASVFQFNILERALVSYRYEECYPQNDHIYAMGIDWNDVANGTKIRILELNPFTKIIKCVDSATVQKAGWTQTTAVQEAINMNRKWNCAYIYVDCGHGATQIELLRKIGLDAQFRKDQYAHRDMNFLNTKGINFSSKIDIFDPISGLPNKMPMKPYMVESAVRFFERGMIQFSSEDEILFKQLHGYNIARIGSTGAPVYEAGPSGDHDLDAFMLALLAFEVEMGEYTKQHFISTVAMSGRFGEAPKVNPMENLPPGIYPVPENQPPKQMGPQKPASRAVEDNGAGILGKINGTPTRIYSKEAFNNDDRNFKNRGRQISRNGRGKPVVSRSIF